MNVKANVKVRGSRYLWPLILVVFLLSIGCGGGTYSTSRPPSPQPQPPPGPSATPPMQGPWEILFNSDAAPSEYTVLEANLSQSGTHISVDASNALILKGEGTAPWVLVLRISGLGGQCRGSGADQVVLDGTLSNAQAVTQSMTFAVTENGALGSAVMTASVSTDGSGTLTGTYTLPAACGFPEEHGTVVGFKDSSKFSGASSYSGSVQANAITVHFASGSSGYGLSATGTYNGGSFALNGSSTGLSFNLTGTISAQAVTWFGLYDSTYNTFRIYDSDANLLGSLNGS
jgi:hypothetical protein